MSEPDRMMVSFAWRDRTPEIGTVAERFGVPLEAFDPIFGVIAVTPGEVCTVRVDRDWAERISGDPGTEGPFPEGKIETFGLEVVPSKKA